MPMFSGLSFSKRNYRSLIQDSQLKVLSHLKDLYSGPLRSEIKIKNPVTSADFVLAKPGYSGDLVKPRPPNPYLHNLCKNRNRNIKIQKIPFFQSMCVC